MDVNLGLQETMPTGWINGNESSPPGGNGDIPSNTHDKVVHAQVLLMKRSRRSNKTDWGIRVSFYLRGNKKKKERQVVTTSGYATEEAAKADLNAFVSLVDRFGHGYKAKWKKYRVSRDSSSISAPPPVAPPPPPPPPPINTGGQLDPPVPKKRLLNASQLKQCKRLRRTLAAVDKERLSRLEYIELFVLRSNVDDSERLARLRNSLQEITHAAISKLNNLTANKSLLHFQIKIRSRLRDVYAKLTEIDSAVTSMTLSMQKSEIKGYLFVSDKSCGDKEYELSEAPKPKYCRHSSDVCKCNSIAYFIGQDEACFKEHASSKNAWRVDTKQQLRPKSDGRTEMISAFQDAYRGFGFAMTEEELSVVNQFRAKKAVESGTPAPPSLQTSPGLVFFTPGTNNDGWWDYQLFANQVHDLMDCFDCLYPDKQMVLFVDHSSGHLKKKDNGLDVSAMNMFYGGKQRSTMCPSTIVAGCLGNNNPILRERDVQHMTFQPGEKILVWKGMENGTREPPEKDQVDSDNKVVREGYMGKPKGIYQVLAERGLFIKGMRGGNARAALDRCTDFATEVTALEELVNSRGHLLLISPKCHPELAGCGIEYSWGKAKMFYRRDNSSTARKEFRTKIEKALKIEKQTDPLHITRVWKFERRTRDYCRAYKSLEESVQGKTVIGEEITYDILENQRKKYKTHRNMQYR